MLLKTVGIAGLGGVGSNVARYLAQARVGSLLLVDYDRVEESNLNRQFYRRQQVGQLKTVSLADNLRQILPSMRIQTIDQKLDQDNLGAIFRDCPILVEGFDDKGMKKALVETYAGTDKILICASGIAGTELESVHRRTIGNCHIVGDLTSDQAEHVLYPPKIALITALMADIVIEKLKELRHEQAAADL